MTVHAPVLMLGIDAADADVLDALMGEHHLPNLQRLRGGGLYGRLRSPADLYAGGVWPTFYTGRSVPSHGIFHSKLWRGERMRVEVASDRWLTARPFWETLSDPGMRSCIIDVPMVLGKPRPLNGIYLGGWGTHDLISKGSWPPGLWRSCERKFGRPAMPVEHFGRQSERSLELLPAQLASATEQLGAIAIDQLTRERWDFGCIVFGAAHRAGHYLWDETQLANRAASRSGRNPALVRIYQQIDEAIGAILETVPDNALVIAFAVHGMGPNPGWSDLLPDILARMDEHRSGAVPRRGMLYAMKQRIPFHWVRPVLNRLPPAVNHRLVSLWSRNMFDWSTTRFFPVPMDEAGYIRINLRGRERSGIVKPGAEYEALCTELTELLLGLADGETGEPIAGEPVRAFAAARRDAPGRELLPDLVVPWAGPPTSATCRLTCRSAPGFEYEVPSTLPSGRSGNHTAQGWFIARGPLVAVGDTPSTYDVVDLVPTVLHHLRAPVPDTLEGRAIDLGIAG
jgi:predicted AlkP superfamily phosphohydrolase/phosphomutase